MATTAHQWEVVGKTAKKTKTSADGNRKNQKKVLAENMPRIAVACKC